MTAISPSCCRSCGWPAWLQVLFGFLLSLPFTNRFDTLSPVQRDLYLARRSRPASSAGVQMPGVAHFS
jgi:hypothetical protein